MKNYQYRIKPMDVIVTMDAESPNHSAKIKYEGQYRKFAMLRLSGASGAFGHIFGVTSSTPIDLDYALKYTFGADNVETLGEEIESYDPGIPEGAMT